jgi:ribosomal protein L3
MKIQQTVEIVGAHIVVTLIEHPGMRVLAKRTYEDAAKYVKGWRELPNGNRSLIMEMPEKAGINIKTPWEKS